MWPFRRHRHAASGSIRLGHPSSDPSAYNVYAVSENRHPDVFDDLWSSALPDDLAAGEVRLWATLVPVYDPKFGVADVLVQIDGRTACYLRPPHLDRVAARLARAHAEQMEVPALIEAGPIGPTVRLLIDEDG